MTARDTRGNVFASLPKAADRELVEALVDDPAVRIERIVSTGQVTPEGYWYDQSDDEFVLLLSGAAVLHFEADDRRITLAAGDWVEIPADVRHRVDWTNPDAPTVWLAVFRRRAGGAKA
jgi:cupin 2 domain-containing protein